METNGFPTTHRATAVVRRGAIFFDYLKKAGHAIKAGFIAQAMHDLIVYKQIYGILV